MDQASLKNLSEAVEENPASGRSASAIEQVAWAAFECLQNPDEASLREGADQTAALAQRWFAAAEEEPNVSLAWYAGQVQSLALLMRAALLREIPLAVRAVFSQKNTSALLEALEEGDLRLSKLAEAVRMDLSQAHREVSRLADHDLVRTMKGGRDRWVRLTNLGHRSLAWSRRHRRRADRGSTEQPLSREYGLSRHRERDAIAERPRDVVEDVAEAVHEPLAGRRTAPTHPYRSEGEGSGRGHAGGAT